MNARKAADEILRECLHECIKEENIRLEAEMKQYEEHVFSEKFEKQMKELLVVKDKHLKHHTFFKYALSAAAVVLVIAGIVSASITSTKATLPSIDILGWFDNHFEFNKGTSTSQDSELVFDEAQITYIPEGFVKVSEEVKFTHIEYGYKNAEGKLFAVRISKAGALPHQDNEEIVRETLINDDGYEYFYIERENEFSYIWEDSEGLFYRVYGNADKEVLNFVMNGIQYNGENK